MCRRLISTLSALAFVFYLAACSRQQVEQTGDAMEPSIRDGQVVEADYRAYRVNKPKRWDVIAFEAPTESHQPEGTQFIMRVVGLPGENISLAYGNLVIDGEHIEVPPSAEHLRFTMPEGKFPKPIQLPYKIGSDEYFVLGDNSTTAYDSRYFGGIPAKDVTAKIQY